MSVTQARLTTEARLTEQRSYPPPADFAALANVGPDIYAQATADPVAFWEAAARRLDWETPWHTAHTWSPPLPAVQPVPGEQPGTASPLLSSATQLLPAHGEQLSVPEATWFAGGRLNVAVNCVDRHVAAGLGSKVALYFEGEPGDRLAVTYADLQRRVAQAAHGLTALGIGPGDRVVVYLPVLVETVVIALACARIGAVHSLVFGGFSAEAVRFRVQDTGAKLLVTSDGQFRRGVPTAIKHQADAAVEGLESIEHVLVVRRLGDALTEPVPWTDGRDVWWHDLMDGQPGEHQPQFFDSEHPLFIIYTSGTTGKPKGLVHTSGGYLTHTGWAHWAHFDAKPDDVHWCTADLAWVTAHTYEIYGPLANALTQVIYEGTPDAPEAGQQGPNRHRHLEIIERYGVTVYYTAPTLIRTLMSWYGPSVPDGYRLDSIRLLGTVGEAINPEAWVWFRDNFGRGSAPVVDTWWQSETGAAMVVPLPGVTTLKPGSATVALPGIDVAVVDDAGDPVAPGRSGTLVVRRPWPGMARTVWGNPQRYLDSYWRQFAGKGQHGGYYVAGDGATVDQDGYIWILGRLDDVVNVSGHRLSTIEVESALVAHRYVGEAGTTGVSDPVTGQAMVAFVTLTPQGQAADRSQLLEALRQAVAQGIGPVAKPRHLVVVPELPKTRSGKILRRLLAQLWEQDPLGDTTSLQNPWAVEAIGQAVQDYQKAMQLKSSQLTSSLQGREGVHAGSSSAGSS